MSSNRNIINRYINENTSKLSYIFPKMTQKEAIALLIASHNKKAWLIRESTTIGMLTVDAFDPEEKENEIKVISRRYAYKINEGWTLVGNKDLPNYTDGAYINCFTNKAQFNLFFNSIVIDDENNESYIDAFFTMLATKGWDEAYLIKATLYHNNLNHNNLNNNNNNSFKPF